MSDLFDDCVTMFLLAFFVFLAFIFIVALFAVPTVEPVKPQQAEQEQVKQVEPVKCEHEFVITSKYNWWLQSYKTISKCTKCGEEI